MVRSSMRVAVAMSGGVDSSIAASILKQQGHDVLGVTAWFNLVDKHMLGNAQRVARFLGIEHLVLDLSDIFQRKVVSNFTQEYCRGRTPNPCLRCNQYVKFGALLKQAISWGCDFMATGHYAQRIESREGFLLKKAKDSNKDQSYFLYRLNQKKLKNFLFPLSNLNKQQVIRMSKRLRLPVRRGKESQEICFLAGQDYRSFLKRRIRCAAKPGLIIDKTGRVLGKHKGIAFYTIGQREGLNIALGYRAYVVRIDAARNQIVLGRLSDAYASRFTLTRPNFILRPIKKRIVCRVKIRYNHLEARATVLPQGRNLRVIFKQPQFAITPGQSAVLYDHNNAVIAGGIIK